MRGLVSSGMIFALFMTLAGSSAVAGQSEGTPREKDRLFQWMVGGYVGLQLADVHLTHRGTRMGLEESNPVFSSSASVTTAKLALVPLTAWGLTRLHRTRPKLATGLAIGLNALYLGVAYSNMKVIDEVD